MSRIERASSYTIVFFLPGRFEPPPLRDLAGRQRQCAHRSSVKGAVTRDDVLPPTLQVRIDIVHRVDERGDDMFERGCPTPKQPGMPDAA